MPPLARQRHGALARVWAERRFEVRRFVCAVFAYGSRLCAKLDAVYAKSRQTSYPFEYVQKTVTHDRCLELALTKTVALISTTVTSTLNP